MRRAVRLLQNYGAQAAGFNTGGGDGGNSYQQQGSLPMTGLKPRSTKTFVSPQSFMQRPPHNTVLNIVPQGHQYVVERLGRYHKTLDSGWWIVIPVIDKIQYAYNVKEQGVEIPDQSAITMDNVMVEIDGVLFLQIVDSRKSSYNIENPIYNLINLAQTTMRSEIGRMTLDNLFRERASLNKNIVDILRREASEWGIECKRYEIRDIVVSELVRRSMDLQAEAERRRRKLVLESEGEAKAEANRAEGLKIAQQLAADAQKYTILKNAEANAEAIRIRSGAVADNISIVAKVIDETKCSDQAIALRVAENYIEQFGNLAKETNTVVMSQPISDPATFSAQALAVFNQVATSASKANLPPTSR